MAPKSQTFFWKGTRRISVDSDHGIASFFSKLFVKKSSSRPNPDANISKNFIPSLSNSCMYSIIASLKYYETKVNLNVKAAPNMVNKRVRIVIKKNMVCFCVSVSKYQEYSNLVTRVCTHTSIGVHVKTHSCIYIYIYIYTYIFFHRLNYSFGSLVLKNSGLYSF